MIAQSFGHSTGDEGIALAMNLCEESGRGIFHLARFLARREKEKAAATSAGTDPIISDACSGYRGGYTDTADPEVKTLLSDIIGKDPYKSISEKPFAFLGDGSDLSYFWKKTPRNTAVMMPRSMIDGIADPSLREKVTSVFAKARIDELLTARGDNYFLTDKGEKAIHRSDFIKNRMMEECRYYGIAFQAIEGEQEKRAMDKIDWKLSELGRNGEFQNCDRIVLMKERLYAGDKEDFLRFYLPGTGRKKTINLPKADVISLDKKSFAAFLRPGTSYSVNGKAMEEKDVFQYFWNKNRNESERIFHAADMGAQASQATPAASLETTFPEEEWIRDWEAEVSPWEDFHVNEISKGDQCFIFFPKNGETALRSCKVEEIFPSPDGNDLYRLRPSSEDGSEQAALLLQKEDLGERFFLTKDEAAQALTNDPKKAKETGELLEKIFVMDVSESSELRVNPAYLKIDPEEKLAYIRIGGRDFEQLEVPESAVQMDKNGSAILHLQPAKIYTVRTGNVSYEVSGKGAEKLMRATKTLAAAGRTVTEAATAAATATVTTAAAAGATAATAGSAAPISAAAKLIQSTVSEASKAGGDGRGVFQGLSR